MQLALDDQSLAGYQIRLGAGAVSQLVGALPRCAKPWVQPTAGTPELGGRSRNVSKHSKFSLVI